MSSDSKDPTIAPDYLDKQYELEAEPKKEATETPKASVPTADEKIGYQSRNITARYYAVSTVKLIVLSTLTFGLYDLYWFYKNWVEIKRRENTKIIPWARALFASFYAFSCFDHVRKSAANTSLNISKAIKWNGIGYLVCNALYRLPDPYWLLSLGSVFFLVSANRAMADINEETGGDEKPLRLQGWDWLLVAVGCLLMAGTLIPESWIPES